jgi:uncharacterized membrane protein YbaN (DUF454 family)
MFLGLAVAGTFLPLLPTTPFLLLATYFFAKSSPRVHRWLLNSRWFGPLIQDWEERRAISLRTKFKAIVIVIVSISLTLYFVQPNRFVTGLILSMVALGLFVIWRIPTYRQA